MACALCVLTDVAFVAGLVALSSSCYSVVECHATAITTILVAHVSVWISADCFTSCFLLSLLRANGHFVKHRYCRLLCRTRLTYLSVSRLLHGAACDQLKVFLE